MSGPRQQLLDLKPQQVPSFDNFVAGRNAELVARLRSLPARDSVDAVYLWGPQGCGRSHLLQAVAASGQQYQRPGLQLAAREVPETLPLTPGMLVIIDDVEQLDAAGQSGLFKAFNTARLIGLSLLLAGSLPPRELALREDLRTRIGQMLIFEIKPLTDEEKADALQRHAWLRGMRMDDSLLHYLLRHGRRDLPSLMSVLDALDQASLEQQRPATLPLLREVLQLELSSSNDSNDETGSV